MPLLSFLFDVKIFLFDTYIFLLLDTLEMCDIDICKEDEIWVF
ncbi:hypothetical protein STFR1_10141 [Bacillus vallismortis]